MAASGDGTGPVNERELVIMRIFDAPRRLVYEAWTNPEHMKNWWGPKGFTSPVCELDVRPGGRWRIVMRGPGGVEHVATGIYEEVAPYDRLVFTNIAEDTAGNRLLEGITSLTFEDQGSGTKMTLRTRMKGIAAIAPAMLAGMETGWNSSLDRLAGLVGAL